jgi:phosphate transport system protein
LVESVAILKAQDEDRARSLIADDQHINEKRFAIEEQAVVLIATQGPMARDVRAIAAILEIVTELERIGDYGKGIGKITLMIGQTPLIKPVIDLPVMATKAQAMLHQALDAFVRHDVALAQAIPPADDEVDDLYNQIYRELIALIMSNPQNMDQATYLLWAAHNLERAADRVINICERVVYMVTGEMEEMS